MINQNVLTPYGGLDDFKLYSSFDECKLKIKNIKIKYKIEIWPNKKCTPAVEWKIIRLENGINMFFAKEKLFKIYADSPFDGTLNNGIKIGMTLDECLKIDKSIFYNDDWEGYESKEGYWLEENLETGIIQTITIFIKELENDELFESYKWAENV